MNNRTKFMKVQALACILLCFTVALTSCKKTDEPKPPEGGGKIEYAPNATFPKIEGVTLNSYSVASGFKYSPEEATRTAVEILKYAKADAGFKPNTEAKEENFVWYSNSKDPSAMLNVNTQNGDVMFDMGMARYRAAGETPGLVEGDKAVEMARTHLKALNFVGDEKELVVGHIGGVNLGVHDEGAEGAKTYKKFTTVRFDRQLGGIPVMGHSRMVVQMAERGSLSGIVRNWTPMQARPLEKTEVKAVDEIKKAMEQHILAENTGASKITVTTLELVYYDKGGVIEPAIHVKAETLYPKEGKGNEPLKVPYDSFEPLMAKPTAVYPFTHTPRKAPNEADDVNRKDEHTERGPDEKK